MHFFSQCSSQVERAVDAVLKELCGVAFGQIECRRDGLSKQCLEDRCARPLLGQGVRGHLYGECSGLRLRVARLGRDGDLYGDKPLRVCDDQLTAGHSTPAAGSCSRPCCAGFIFVQTIFVQNGKC